MPQVRKGAWLQMEGKNQPELGKKEGAATMDCLETLFNHFNAYCFQGGLPRPLLVVGDGVNRTASGYATLLRCWEEEGQRRCFYELSICRPSLCQPSQLVLANFLHELVHLRCLQLGIKDTSRGGTWHNKSFRRVAQEAGLLALSDGDNGYARVVPGPGLAEYIREQGLEGLDLLATYRAVSFPAEAAAVPEEEPMVRYSLVLSRPPGGRQEEQGLLQTALAKVKAFFHGGAPDGSGAKE